MSSKRKPERNFMTFTIDVDNNITVLASTEKIEERQEGTKALSSPDELAALAASGRGQGWWRSGTACRVWNQSSGPPPDRWPPLGSGRPFRTCSPPLAHAGGRWRRRRRVGGTRRTATRDWQGGTIPRWPK